MMARAMSNSSMELRAENERWGRWDIFACLVLLGCCAIWLLAIPLPYQPMDDPTYILDNPYVRNGLSWATVQWAFTTTLGGFWFPLTWLSLALDSTLFGMHAWGYHLTNVLFHAMNTLLVYALFRRLTAGERTGTWKACLFAAALFAVHPQRVESVVWAVERKDVLAAFFGLLTLLMYLVYVRKPSPERYLGVTLLLVCSLLSKPMLVTIPALLLVLDYWPLERLKSGRVWAVAREKIPWLLIALAISLNTYLIQLSQGVLAGSMGERARNAAVNYFLYVRDFFYMRHLAVVYGPMPWVGAWQVTAAVLFVVAVTAIAATLAWRNIPGGKPFLVGWLWYAGVVFPMSGIVQSGYNIRADRFSYFPMLGLTLALVWGVLPLLSVGRWRWGSMLAAIAVVGLLGWLSVERMKLWQDPAMLAEHDLRIEPDNAMLEALAGFGLEKHLEFDATAPDADATAYAEKEHELRDRAFAHFRRAEKLDPSLAPMATLQGRGMDAKVVQAEADRAAFLARLSGRASTQP
jgi:hypothetical protein